MKGIFSQEANKEAEEKINSLNNILGINGTNSRTSSLEVVQCLYSLSKWKNPNEQYT